MRFEYACQEGNYGLANTLSGARVKEREAAAQGTTPRDPVPPPRR
jgi:hypothetical protein